MLWVTKFHIILQFIVTFLQELFSIQKFDVCRIIYVILFNSAIVLKGILKGGKNYHYFFHHFVPNCDIKFHDLAKQSLLTVHYSNTVIYQYLCIFMLGKKCFLCVSVSIISIMSNWFDCKHCCFCAWSAQ